MEADVEAALAPQPDDDHQRATDELPAPHGEEGGEREHMGRGELDGGLARSPSPEQGGEEDEGVMSPDWRREPEDQPDLDLDDSSSSSHGSEDSTEPGRDREEVAEEEEGTQSPDGEDGEWASGSREDVFAPAAAALLSRPDDTTSDWAADSSDWADFATATTTAPEEGEAQAQSRERDGRPEGEDEEWAFAPPAVPVPEPALTEAGVGVEPRPAPSPDPGPGSATAPAPALDLDLAPFRAACEAAFPTAGRSSTAPPAALGESDPLMRLLVCSGRKPRAHWATCKHTRRRIETALGLNPPRMPLQPLQHARPFQFDVNSAAAAMWLMTVAELEASLQELRPRAAELSEELVEHLSQKDALRHEHDVKNRFVAGLLRVVAKYANRDADLRATAKVRRERRLGSSSSLPGTEPGRSVVVIPYIERPLGPDVTTCDHLIRVLDALEQDKPALLHTMLAQYIAVCL